MNGQRYGNVDMFKYLGSLVTKANGIKTEIKLRTVDSKKMLSCTRKFTKENTCNI